MGRILIHLIVLSGLLAGLSACMTNRELNDFSEYRSYPFQWVYPEYFYKAETISVQKDQYSTDGLVQVSFFGLSAKIPVGYAKLEKNISDTVIGFRSKLLKNSGFTISIDDGTFFMGSELSRDREKDYYSAFGSVKEWYHKHFTLTPDMIDETTPTGDLWLIHGKGVLFESVRKIEIYEGDDFIAYVRFHKKDFPYLETEIVIFHDSLPKQKYIAVGFRNVGLDVGQFLSTLKEIE